MNRSIFQICKLKNFNFRFFLLNFIISLIICLFNSFYLCVLVCDELLKTVVNNIVVRHSPLINTLRLYNSVTFLHNHVVSNCNSNYKFNIYKYKNFDGSFFPCNSVFNHFHINFYLNNIYNVHYNFLLTHNPYNLNLLPFEYNKFTIEDLNQNDKIQYIMSNLYIYDLDVLKFDNYNYKYNDYILTNKEKCIIHLNKALNLK